MKAGESTVGRKVERRGGRFINIRARSQHLLVQRELRNPEARAEGGDISHPNTFLNITIHQERVLLRRRTREGEVD
jgi:hypothetical protein